MEPPVTTEGAQVQNDLYAPEDRHRNMGGVSSQQASSQDEDPLEEMLARRHKERAKAAAAEQTNTRQDDFLHMTAAASSAFSKIKWRDHDVPVVGTKLGGDARSHLKTFAHAQVSTAQTKSKCAQGVSSDEHCRSWTSGHMPVGLDCRHQGFKANCQQ